MDTNIVLENTTSYAITFCDTSQINVFSSLTAPILDGRKFHIVKFVWNNEDIKN